MVINIASDIGPRYQGKPTISILGYSIFSNIDSVMNCSFNNPKSSRFFPRLHDEEEWNNGLNCTGIQEE